MVLMTLCFLRDGRKYRSLQMYCAENRDTTAAIDSRLLLTYQLPATLYTGIPTYANVVCQTCGAPAAVKAAATVCCNSTVGVKAIMSPPRPVPLILAPMAPA